MAWASSTGYEPDTDPEMIYYNASIINNRTVDTGGAALDPQVYFNETRTTPLINDASKFFFSIVRFTINGPNLNMPMFIPQIQIGQTDPDLTIYSITQDLSATYFDASAGVSRHFDLSSGQVYIEHIPERPLDAIPKPPVETQEVANSRYYWISTYSHWLTCVNNAFATAQANLQTQLNAAWTAAGGVSPAPTITSQAPYIIRDPTANLFSLYADTYGYGGPDRTSAGSATADEDFTIYFNSNMWGLFANFENYFLGGDLNQGREYQIVVKNVLGQNIGSQASPSSSPAPTTKYYIMTQDYQSTSTLWSPISSIVFSTNMIPVIVEQQGDPLILGQSATGNINSGLGFSPIITDIAVANENANGYREFLEYLPTAEYRLASMGFSKVPIRTVDIRVFFKLRLTGELVPMSMFNLSSVDVKVLFRRRDFNIPSYR